MLTQSDFRVSELELGHRSLDNVLGGEVESWTTPAVIYYVCRRRPEDWRMVWASFECEGVACRGGGESVWGDVVVARMSKFEVGGE